MDNLDDSENNAKISDSAYSNSCSNSQSRRSHSSKSTHSGSSGSSGYCGKPSTSGSSNKLEQSSKKDKDAKKKKLSQAEVIVVEEPVVVECVPPEAIPHCDAPKEEINDVADATIPPIALPEKAFENMDYTTTELVSQKHEIQIATMQAFTAVNLEASCQVASVDSVGFSCAISMHDGVVMYTTQTLTTNLGFPREMWIGRSFIDFVHPKDRNTFASQITKGLAVPKIVNVHSPDITECTMVCRIRRYRSLQIGFGVKDRVVAYMPFLLKFSFKDINEEDGKIVYLIIQATPIFSGYKTPNECKTDAAPFIIRHSAAGILEYIDIESVPYLGYLPQDVHNKDALLLYHPEDLPYLKTIYETIVKEGSVSKSMPYRMLTQNGDYVKLETEWSSFINPWSMKLEFVVGKHYIIEGPATPDVFLSPPKAVKASEEEKNKTKEAETYRENILKILKDVLTKPAEKAKQQMSKRCHDLALIMESQLEEQQKPEDELRVEIQEPDLNCCERDSVMLGGISPHHEHNDSKSSTGTPLSYNQLNYNENLQRYFDSHQNYYCDENNPILAVCDNASKASPSNCVLSPLAQHSAESNDMSSSGSSNALMNSFSPPGMGSDFHVVLTESILTKHNTDMEKELAKYHRETRNNNKGERSDNRQKKKEHLARCNATYQPTASVANEATQSHGVKRSLMSVEVEIAQKQHCSQSRQTSRRHTSVTDAVQPTTATTTVAATYTWQDATNSPQTLPVNPYVMGMQQQMPMLPQVSGVFPYYAPITNALTPIMAGAPIAVSMPVETTQHQILQLPTTSAMTHYSNPAVPWMYPQPAYGSQYMYSQMSYSHQQQQALLEQTMAYNQSLNPLGLPNNNYMQACKSLPLRPTRPVGQAADKKPGETYLKAPDVLDPSNGDTNMQHRVTDTVPLSKAEHSKSNPQLAAQPMQNSDEPTDKTDGESSYSSFYSSFFKTESGSAEDSSDPKKSRSDDNKRSVPAASCYIYEPQGPRKAPRRKMQPPWMETVNVTSDLIFKYQIQPKSKEEVLKADLERMKSLEQPSLVNEQLGQLYLDLQLEGVASRLTLEEGITSSSSSGDETGFNMPKVKLAPRRKREYSKLNMIYEEDAPLPPPTELDESCGESSQIKSA